MQSQPSAVEVWEDKTTKGSKMLLKYFFLQGCLSPCLCDQNLVRDAVCFVVDWMGAMNDTRIWTVLLTKGLAL